MCSEGSSVSRVLIPQAGISGTYLWDCSTCTATSRIRTYLGWGSLFLCFVLGLFPLALVMIYTEYFRGRDWNLG